MVVLNAYSVSSTSYSHDVFGGNILSTRDTVGEGSSFVSVAEQLNITSFRYPGGSISEHYFDITDPNSTSAPHINGVDAVNLLPLSDFFGFLKENGYAASIVIPTRSYLTEATDVQGNRFAAVDEDALRKFVNDVLDGEYGLVSIDAFEIGNEYWNSGGMTSIEYGRVASEMYAIIHDALVDHPDYEALFSTPRVLVQMGADYGYADLSTYYADIGDGAAQLAAFNSDYGFNFGDEYIYSSGKVKWSLLSNEIIIREFTNSALLDIVDGVVAHVYSRGAELPSSRYFTLRTIDNSWGNYFDDLFVHITEWNQSASTKALDHEDDFGLLQAHEMLNILEAFAAYEIGCARVWPLQQNTANDLSGDVGQTDLTVPGHMFALMSEHLVGTRPIQLNPDARQPEDEISADGADIHAFYAEDRMVMFIASTSERGADLTLDIGQLISDEVGVNVTILGVADGQIPTDNSSVAEIRELVSDTVYRDQHLELSLDSYEIAMVEIIAPTYTDTFIQIIDGASDSTNVENNDLIYGGADSDLIEGGAGFDTLFGGAGDDTLNGGDHADLLEGGTGNDRLVGEDGFDNLFGNEGRDTLLGGDRPDRLYGGDGNDVLRGGINVGLTVDGLFGEAGDDSLFGDGGYDMLDGGEGNDYLDGGDQADNLYGRAGDDVLIGGQGFDRLFGGADQDNLAGGEGSDGLFGQQGNDTLDGGADNDRLWGGTGNDGIAGGAGNDLLLGGAGFDTLEGGLGNDTLAGNFNADLFVFADGHGDDTISDFAATNVFERIDLSAVTAIIDLADLWANHVTQVGFDVLIDTGDGNSITLADVSLADLDATDFLF